MKLMPTWIKNLFKSVIKKEVSSFSNLETIIDQNIVVGKDGSLMSMFRINGCRKMFGEPELLRIMEKFDTNMASIFEAPGHAIQFYFMRDPSQGRKVVENQVSTARFCAKSLELKIDDILDERVNVLGEYIALEDIYLAFWTRPSILSKEELQDMQLQQQSPSFWPSMPDTQDIFRGTEVMLTRHIGVVRSLFDSFTKTAGFDMQCEMMHASEIIRAVRFSLYPETNMGHFTPSLPPIGEDKRGPLADDIVIPMSHGFPKNKQDISPLLYPNIDDQIFDRAAITRTPQIIEMGDNYFAFFDMFIGPKNPAPFSDLMEAIYQKDFPWRVSFLLEGDSFSMANFRLMIASLLTITNKDNFTIKDALDDMNEYRSVEGGNVCRLRVQFLTWSSTTDGKRTAFNQIKANAVDFQNTISKWGGIQTHANSGDPVASTLTSTAGLTPLSTANPGLGPLPDVARMLPWSRDASIFKTGPVLFRTKQGRPWIWSPGSSKQDTFIDLIFARPGGGKSVFLNTMNLAFCLNPANIQSSGPPQLPRLAIIDIGFSSSGLISMLKSSLPDNRKFEVISKSLAMDKSNAINPFDTPLGCRTPLMAQRQFLINFLCLLGTGRYNVTPPKGLDSLVSPVIDELYEHFNDQGAQSQPKIYTPGDNVLIDDLLAQENIKVNPDETTWWWIVDELFTRGFAREALIAQRYAVPVISDIAIVLKTPQIEALYGSMVSADTGAPIIADFQRIISESTRSYPIISQPTQFDLGNARVASVDLSEVAPVGDRKQSSLMYMLARHVLASDFYTDDRILNQIPPLYMKHHKQKLKSNQSNHKRIVYDEFHRTEGADAVRQQVITDMREGRKYGVEIMLASQLYSDFTPAMVAIASGYWIFALNEQQAGHVADIFNLNETATLALKNDVTGPTPEGAPCLSVTNMKNSTQHQHLIYNTLGAVEQWAFTTSQRDAQLRARLYKILGPQEARKALAKFFPSGSAQSYINAKIEEMAQQNIKLSESNKGDILADLVDLITKRTLHA